MSYADETPPIFKRSVTRENAGLGCGVGYYK
jgi:hypothetical protein